MKSAVIPFFCKKGITFPESFINVCGFIKRMGISLCVMVHTSIVSCFLNSCPYACASASTTRNPILCRVNAYLSPGLPSPIIALIGGKCISCSCIVLLWHIFGWHRNWHRFCCGFLFLFFLSSIFCVHFFNQLS